MKMLISCYNCYELLIKCLSLIYMKDMVIFYLRHEIIFMLKSLFIKFTNPEDSHWLGKKLCSSSQSLRSPESIYN